MRRVLLLAALALGTAAGAHAGCVVRVGYVDQNRPPYYLGSGAAEARPAGASVDLMHEIVAAAGCAMESVRLPLPRIRSALANGTIDAAPIDAQQDDAATFAFPRARDGAPDPHRALALLNVVFVRAADKSAADAQPLAWLQGKRLGVPHGAPYPAAFRSAGMTVDEGALDGQRNLDKLLLGRIDAFTAALTAPGDLDAELARYQGAIVRLEKPLRTSNVWLAVSKAFYEKHTREADIMWTWIANRGRARFSELLRGYQPVP